MQIRRSVAPLSFLLILSLGLGLAPALTQAELVDHGVHNEYFHDSSTGLYWFDPGVFYGGYRGTIDFLATYSPTWNWATSAQIDALVGESTGVGSDLVDVMGPRLTTIANGGPRWVGYYAVADPDGWLIESNDTPAFDTLTASGFQGGAAGMGVGAWLVSSTDPSVTAAVLVNHGSQGEYFEDQGTGLFWCDPATFYGMSRSEVETWFVATPGWRWATAAEVYGLLGKAAADGSALDTIIGLRLTTVGSGGPRWVGFYDQATEPTGILLEAGIASTFHFFSGGGTQGGAAGLGAGAWVVRDSDPLPAEDRSWGDVKALFR